MTPQEIRTVLASTSKELRHLKAINARSMFNFRGILIRRLPERGESWWEWTRYERRVALAGLAGGGVTLRDCPACEGAGYLDEHFDAPCPMCKTFREVTTSYATWFIHAAAAYLAAEQTEGRPTGKQAEGTHYDTHLPPPVLADFEQPVEVR